MRMKQAILAAVFVVLLVAIALSRLNQPAAGPKAAAGRLDLSGWTFEENGPIHLDGEWEFAWGELLEPGDFEGRERSDYLAGPGAWNGHVMDGRELPGEGYATYRLHVDLPDWSRPLALWVPYMSTSYRLWIDGREAAANGRVGTSRAEAAPQYVRR